MAEHLPDSPPAPALAALCAHFGIAPSYHDIWGAQHPVPPASLEALLAEFGVRADPPQPALDAARHEAWRRPLPPALAIGAGKDGWRIALRLPAAWPRLAWALREEGGALHRGELDAHAEAERERATLDGVTWCERSLPLPLALPPGYHRLRFEGLAGETLLICAPERCFRPPALQEGGRAWGPTVQLYGLRSPRNWGIGDFSDLAQLAGQMGEAGADILGLSPLHALFAHNPAHASPYSPSSRQQLNVLYIDVEAAAEFHDCEPAQRLVRSAPFQARLAALRETPLVDYRGVAAAKFEVLALLFAHFRTRHMTADGRSPRDMRGRAFAAFVAERGETLRRHALFEAVQAHFHAADPAVWGWPVWPQDHRDPEGAAVREFAERHADRVQFHQYLQWLAATQLAMAAERCRSAGMGIGLYLDLAVSVDRAGSDAWSQQAVFAAGASVGAPPDEFNPNGQGWGLPPLRPDRLRETGYAHFIEILRANMRSAGALRIDHVMGLMRLFWIPPGQSPAEGAYVHYALDEMLAIVALESQRHRCMVIGEDLGTVADAMRQALARAEVLSYRLMVFERDARGDFKPPPDYPAGALVAVSTHDLATLAGWWAGTDLQLRLSLALFPKPEMAEQQLLERSQDRVRLLLALRHAGLLTMEEAAAAAGSGELSPAVVEAVHVFLARAPSRLMLVQLEDVAGVREQANLPGTTDAHPNWQRKLPLDFASLASGDAMRSLAGRLAQERPRRAGSAAPGAGVQAEIPRATYRLQFHKNFGFDDAIGILPYLARLGISHVYCSPIQRARAGSLHGYDVVAHDEINSELGGPEGFARFTAALHGQGMGQLIDLVPNHMGVLGADNAWWMDVLENGPASLFSQHFDIDWQPLNPELAGKVLLPVLGDHYGEVLLGGELVLGFDELSGNLALHYFEHRFPLAPETYPAVLLRAQSRLDDADIAAGLASTATAFGHLPSRASPDAGARAERARDKELLKARLARLVAHQPSLGPAIAAAVAEFNLEGQRELLHQLIEAQAYRLAYWRVASDEINYRRFFDINELAALRMERPEVFEATQSFALRLAASGAVQGLRIDHPDGLYDPAGYFAQLQAGYARRAGLVLPTRDADGRPARPLYVVAEKIAAPHEEVPESWHVHGTTGYRFANVANGVLVDTSAEARFGQIWRHFTGVEDSFEEIAYAGKREIMRTGLASELTVLASELLRIARADRRTRDYTLNALRRALTQVVACLPVYRTYLLTAPSAQDVRYVDLAVKEAERRSEDADPSVFAFVRETLLARAVEGADAGLREQVLRFAVRLQQFSAPVAAKGVEDTAFYRYFPLASLNEVGGEPAIFGMSTEAFHEASADRCRRWPHTLLATSTHDNKRSEDVRNRINVLSEMPTPWRQALRRWRGRHHVLRQSLMAGGAPPDAPSYADEYLLYQTLLGTVPAAGLDEAALPAYRERILAYTLKAAREAKRHTRWTKPVAAYEEALAGFVRGLLERVEGNAFLDELQALGRELAWFGALNSLSLTLLKYGSPGVPDLYQGNELMDLSLVDPDNRRPVDFALRARWLDELIAMAGEGDAGLPARVTALAQAPHDGRAKLWLVWRLLSLRREQPGLFRGGSYRGLAATGAQADHVVAFERRHGGQVLLVLALRLPRVLAAGAAEAASGGAAPLPIGPVWGDTMLPLAGFAEGARFDCVLTGAELRVRHGAIALAAALAHFPGAALLHRREDEEGRATPRP